MTSLLCAVFIECKFMDPVRLSVTAYGIYVDFPLAEGTTRLPTWMSGLGLAQLLALRRGASLAVLLPG